LIKAPTENQDSSSNVATESKAENRILRIGISQYPSTLHPGIETMVAKFYVLGMLSRSITRYDPDWNLVCNLCITLMWTPDGKDGLAVTFEIPNNVKWGDGTPLTAEDIYFSWQVGRDSKTGSNGLDFFRRTYAFDIVDAQTFTLHIDKVVFDYNDLSQFYPLPKHLDEVVFKENPTEYRHRTLTGTAKFPILMKSKYSPYKTLPP